MKNEREVVANIVAANLSFMKGPHRINDAKSPLIAGSILRPAEDLTDDEHLSIQEQICMVATLPDGGISLLRWLFAQEAFRDILPRALLKLQKELGILDVTSVSCWLAEKNEMPEGMCKKLNYRKAAAGFLVTLRECGYLRQSGDWLSASRPEKGGPEFFPK